MKIYLKYLAAILFLAAGVVGILDKSLFEIMLPFGLLFFTFYSE
jgi:hypothetical protein